MSEVFEINDVSQLAGIRADWDSLLGQTANATFFQTLDWLEIYWKHNGQGQRLRVVVVREDDQTVGIVPLAVRPEPTRAGRLRALTFPLHGWGSFYGPIGPAPEKSLGLALKHVRQTRRDWDVIELRWVHPEDADAGRIERAFQSAGLEADREMPQQTAVVDLTGTWDSYLASRTSKWRNNYRRWERRLAERGTVRYLRHRPGIGGDPRWDLYEACETIASHSWQTVANDTSGTTLTHDSIRGYLREMHQVAAALGSVEMNLLYLNEKPLAFAYNYVHQGSIYGLRVGYDPAVAQDGAGNLLYAFAIRDSFERGDRIYDMGPGSLGAKHNLLTRILPIHRYDHFHPTALRAQLVRLKRRLAAKALGTGVAETGAPPAPSAVSTPA